MSITAAVVESSEIASADYDTKVEVDLGVG
jgi:hypothetical protein